MNLSNVKVYQKCPSWLHGHEEVLEIRHRIEDRLETSLVVGRSKDWQKAVVERRVRQPEHGRREPVEEVLHQLNGDAGSRISSVVNERHVELRHIGRSAQPTNNNANRFGQKIRVVYPNRSKTLLVLIDEFCTTY